MLGYGEIELTTLQDTQLYSLSASLSILGHVCCSHSESLLNRLRDKQEGHPKVYSPYTLLESIYDLLVPLGGNPREQGLLPLKVHFGPARWALGACLRDHYHNVFGTFKFKRPKLQPPTACLLLCCQIRKLIKRGHY